MRPMFDRERFAEDIRDGLAAGGLSYRDASLISTSLNPAMISRAIKGETMTRESFLALCAAFGLAPLDYLKTHQNHAVTAADKRETGSVSYG